MKIEKLPTDKLIPYARNAKKHDAAQVSKLAGSIREFGFNNPVLIDKDNGIIAGHGRVMAAQQLGLSEVPCIRLGHLTDNQRRAYILADNRLAEVNSGWDEELLKLEVSDIDWGDIKGLSVDDFEFGEIDFGEDEKQQEKSDTDAEPQIDKAEELRAKWGVEPGQLWELGDHRLLCGDSTKKEDVDRVMGGESAGAVVTDPPYGTGIKAHGGLGNSNVAMNLVGDEDASLARRAFAFWSPLSKIQIWWGANYYSDVVPGCSSWAVWDKDHHGMTYADAELAYVSCGGPVRVFRHAWSGMHRASERGTERQHPTQKPVALYKWMFDVWIPSNALVADPFSGSGTTIIACEQLGRKCRAIEISPAYVAVAIQRWADATGKAPRKL